MGPVIFCSVCWFVTPLDGKMRPASLIKGGLGLCEEHEPLIPDGADLTTARRLAENLRAEENRIEHERLSAFEARTRHG